MHICCFSVDLLNSKTNETFHLQRERMVASTPRKDEDVILTPGGWMLPVRNVYYDLDKSPSVPHVVLGYALSSRPVKYDPDHENLYVIARSAGWR